MDFNLTDEQKMLAEGAERYLCEHYGFVQRRDLLKRDGGFSEAEWRQFAQLGWLALPIPEDCEGLGGSFLDVALIMQAVGRRLVIEPYASSTILCAHLIDAADEPSLRRRLLSGIAAGDTRVALAYAELQGRYDPSSVETVADARADIFALTGSKSTVLDAPSAHHLIVSAVVDSEPGFSLFLVDAQAPGLELRRYRLIDGSQCADLTLDATPAERLLQAPTSLLRLEAALDRTVLAQVAESLGAMEQVLEITAEQIRNRSQFGQALSRFQALQHRMAEMFVEVQEVRSILYRGLSMIDAPAEQRKVAVSIAKVVASGAARIVGAQGIQLHGGVGMTEEYAVGHYFKRLVTIEKSHGDCDYHLARIARTYQGSEDEA